MGTFVHGAISSADGRHAFFLVLFNPQVSMQRTWVAWERQYKIVTSKAIALKKLYLSHQNRFRGCEELSSGTLRRVEEEYAKLFSRLDEIIFDKWIDAQQKEFGLRGSMARKHPLWTDLMKRLESLLAPVFSPKRQWEEPGGFRGRVVVPADVYTTINKILHFSVPTVWSLDSKTTASIKSRCQQSSRGFRNSLPFCRNPTEISFAA